MTVQDKINAEHLPTLSRMCFKPKFCIWYALVADTAPLVPGDAPGLWPAIPAAYREKRPVDRGH